MAGSGVCDNRQGRKKNGRTELENIMPGFTALVIDKQYYRTAGRTDPDGFAGDKRYSRRICGQRAVPSPSSPLSIFYYGVRAMNGGKITLGRTAGLYLGAAVLRLALFTVFPGLPDLLTGRVEVSTPVTSFKRRGLLSASPSCLSLANLARHSARGSLSV